MCMCVCVLCGGAWRVKVMLFKITFHVFIFLFISFDSNVNVLLICLFFHFNGRVLDNFLDSLFLVFKLYCRYLTFSSSCEVIYSFMYNFVDFPVYYHRLFFPLGR